MMVLKDTRQKLGIETADPSMNMKPTAKKRAKAKEVQAEIK